jgi:hypothetical protein
MTRLKLLGAAAVLATVMASPAMAQEVIYNPGYCAQFYPDANCQNKGPGNPYTGDYQRRTAYRDDGYRQRWNNDWNSDRNNDRSDGWNQSWNDNPVSWPGDVAASAVGTAGAIASAPFRAGNAYAYDDGNYDNRFGNGYAHSDYYANAHAGQGWNGIYSNSHNNSYASRNGFVCEPGSFFRGEDGRRHRCQ